MSDTETKKAVVLLSGGLDSATALAIAREEGFECHALTVRYGQRHQAELAAAERVASKLGAESHHFVDVDLTTFGGSALTDDIPVPKHRSGEEIAAGIPVTYVPARNTIFLALALAQAEVLDARDMFIGVTAVDYSGYPDCRPDFIHAFTRVANLATRAGVEGARPFHIHTPLIDLTKAEIIRRGTDLGVDYGLTMSCYDPTPEGEHCGACDACLLRRRGFVQAGIADPTHYEQATDA